MSALFAKFRGIVTNQADNGGAIGGFALLCSLLYIFVAALWPALLILGRSEPEGLLLSLFFAPPAFIGVNIFGIAGLLSSSARNRLLSMVSLCVVWVITLGIGAMIVWAMYMTPVIIIDTPAPLYR